MTVVRQRAMDMVESMPEQSLYYLIRIMESVKEMGGLREESRKTEAQLAYQELKKYRKKGTTDRDYRRELQEALEEKYAGIN